MVTFRQLRYFSALARLRHFGRAASECRVSQPALSLQIQELEAVLGCRLVERGRNAVVLTAEGEEVFARAQRILTEANDLADSVRGRGEILAGPLALGVIPSLAPYLLPAALPELHRRHPAIDLRLRETQTAALLDELGEGRLDLCALSLPAERSGLATLPLFQDPFVLVQPSEGAQPEPEAALRGDGLLLLEEGHCLRDQALSFCRIDGASRRGFGATSLSTLVQMVANGFGATLLPAIALPVEIAAGMKVTLHRFSEPAPARMIGLAWRETSPRAESFRALGAVLQEVGQRQLAAAPAVAFAGRSLGRPDAT